MSEVRFSCTQCGHCCRFGPSSVVYITDAEADRIAAYLGVPTAEFVAVCCHIEDGALALNATADNYCVLFDPFTKACNVHAVKPAQCSSFPFWPSALRDWEATGERCEGIGQGPVISEEELTARLRAAPGWV